MTHKATIARLHADGWNQTRIAAELGMTQSGVAKHARLLGLKFPTGRPAKSPAPAFQVVRRKRVVPRAGDTGGMIRPTFNSNFRSDATGNTMTETDAPRR